MSTEKLMRVEFFMRNGTSIVTENVSKVEMTRNMETGSYDGYSIEWGPGKAPSLFTLSIPEIIAVVTKDME